MTAAEVARLLDLEALRQLKHRYLRTLDLKQWDAFAECFVPEATGDYGGLAFDDRTALVDFMRTNLGPGVITHHQAHHPEISIDGDQATAVWYLHDRVMVPEVRFVKEGAAFYDDRCVRTPDGWRIAHTGYRRTYEADTVIPADANWTCHLGTALDLAR